MSGPRAKGPQAFSLVDGAGRLEGPFNALVEAASVGQAVQALGSALRYETALSARQREIAVLELAVTERSPFEWIAHKAVGRAAGLEDDEIAGLLEGIEVKTFDASEKVVRESVRSMLHGRDLSDGLFERAASLLGVTSVVELVVLVGYYQMLALNMKVLRTPLPVGATDPWAVVAEPAGVEPAEVEPAVPGGKF